MAKGTRTVEFGLIAIGFRFVLATVFLVAGLSKLGRALVFERALYGYGLLPSYLVPVVARALPPLELVCAVLLYVGLATSAVSLALAVLLTIFTGAVAFNLARGRQIDCGCFGEGVRRSITWSAVMRNVVLTAMAVAVTLEAPRALAVDALVFGNVTSSHREALAVLVATTAGLAALAIFAIARDLRDALRRATEVTA